MNVFWKEKPLAAVQAKLLNLVLAAHDKSAVRGNPSTVVLCNSAVGRGDYFSALAAALCSIGGTHAPLFQTYAFLVSFKPEEMEQLRKHLDLGLKIPGWGNGFYKGEPDALWRDVDAHIAEHWPELHGMITVITDELHARGKMIYPNPSTFTALTAIILELPPQIIGWLLVQGRLSAWSRVFFNTIAEQGAPKHKEEKESEGELLQQSL